MAAKGSSERTMIARIGGHARWINEDDRTAATAKARQASWDRFEREVDPDGVLKPEVRKQRADAARRAHYARMALRSAQARREKSGKQKAVAEK